MPERRNRATDEGRNHDVHRGADIRSGWLMLHLGGGCEPREAPWPWMQRAEHDEADAGPASAAGRGGGGSG